MRDAESDPRVLMSTVIGFILLGTLLSGCAATLEPVAPAGSPDTSYPLRAATVDYLTASAAAPMGVRDPELPTRRFQQPRERRVVHMADPRDHRVRDLKGQAAE